MDVAVIGGGVTGLACAYYLLRRGLRPVVLEAGPAPYVTPEAGELLLDPLPVTLRHSDTAVCGLISDLGLSQSLQWQSARSGLRVGGRSCPFDAWSDLLRLTALPRLARLRAAAVTYGSMRLRTYGRPLDSVRAEEWLGQAYGIETYHSLWRPILAARFGAAHVDWLPAYLAWQYLREELLGGGRSVGALRGGMVRLEQALVHAIDQAGGTLRFDTPVRRISAGARGAAVETDDGQLQVAAAIAALPLALLPRLLDAPLADPLAQPLGRTEPQRVTSVRLRVSDASPLGGYSRLLLLDPDAPFPALFDASSLASDARDARTLLYLVRVGGKCRVHPRDARRSALDTLRRLTPRLAPDQIQNVELFQWDSPERVFPIDTLRRPIPRQLGPHPVYLCTPAQAYPRGASPESSVILARDCVGRVSRQIG